MWKSDKEIGQLKANFIKTLSIMPSICCLYPMVGGCSEKVIKSHSVQRRHRLSSIVDSSNHVIMFTHDIPDLDPRSGGKVKAKAELVGINNAGVFNGLCSRHDDQLFLPIEQGKFDISNASHLFLTAYRSIFLEQFKKRVAQAQFRQIRTNTQNLPNTHPMAKFMSERILLETSKGNQWVSSLKRRFDNYYISEHFDSELDHWATSLKCKPTLAVCAAFTPGFNFERERIQVFQLSIVPDWISISVLPEGAMTHVSFTTAKSCSNRVKALVERLKFANQSELELLISELILQNVENFALSPDYWNSRTNRDKREMLKYFRATLEHHRAPPPQFPREHANLFSK